MEPGAIDVELTFDEGASIEHVLVTPLALHQYRLEESPVSGDNLRYRDVIEAEPQADGCLRFLRLVEKSPFRISVYFLPKNVIDSQQFQDVLKRVLEIGGNWEIVFGGVVYLHVLRAKAFDPTNEIQAIRDALS
jgi:hypothetical protein